MAIESSPACGDYDDNGDHYQQKNRANWVTRVLFRVNIALLLEQLCKERHEHMIARMHTLEKVLA